MSTPDDRRPPGSDPTPRIVHPRRTDVVDGWLVHAWPDVDAPTGALVALEVPVPAVPGELALLNGWQSWSAPVVRRLGAHPAPSRPSGGHRRHGIDPYLVGETDTSADVIVTTGWVAGVLAGGALCAVEAHRGVLRAWRRHTPAATHPDVWVASGDGPARADDLATRAGAVHGARPSIRAPLGWSSWEAFEWRIDELLVARQAALAASVGCDVVWVDDGWQAAIGDWAVASEAFPAGRATLAATIARTGATPALWLAPVLAAPSSALVANHPDWVARGPDGKPVVAASVDHWGGPAWALDPGAPGYRDWLTELMASLAAEGWGAVKLDFLHAAADAADATGRSHETALAVVYEAVRTGGPELVVVACGAPLWPSIGRVDVMRIGPDATRAAVTSPPAGVDHAMAAGIANAWRSGRLRHWWHRRLWVNDVDMVAVARRAVVPPGRPPDAPDELLAAFGSWVAASGSMLTVSDDLTSWDRPAHRRWETWRAAHAAAPAEPPERSLAVALTPP